MVYNEQPIGNVEEISGTVTATHADGTIETLTTGSPVYQGDVINTSDDGGIGIILSDDTTFSMGDSGQITLDEMVYDPATQEGNIALDLAQGVFTFVSGNIAKTDPDAMTLDTPVATIGIRGTQVGININGETVGVVLMKEADGFAGEITISNENGVQVINTAHMGTTIVGDNAPTTPSEVSVEEIIGTYQNSLEMLPINNNANPYTDEEILLQKESGEVIEIESNSEFKGNASDGTNYAVTEDADNGSITMNDDGSYTYVPNDGFVGTDSATITYTNADGEDVTETITFNISDNVNFGDSTTDKSFVDTASGNEDSGFTDNVVHVTDNTLYPTASSPVVPLVTPEPISTSDPTPANDEPPTETRTPDPVVEPVTEVNRITVNEITTSVEKSDPVITSVYVDTPTTEGNVVTVMRGTTTTETIYVITTNTTKPITTITYSDGTTDIIVGGEIVETIESQEVSNVLDDALYSTATTVDVITTSVAYSDPLVTSTATQTSAATDEDDNGTLETVITTEEITTVTMIDATTTVITVPTTTIVYADGRTKVTTATPTTTTNVVTTETTATATELVSTAVTVDVVTTSVSTDAPVTTTAQGDDVVDTEGNVTTTSNAFTDTTTSNTTTAVTVTPTTTITYADGRIEVTEGIPVVTETVAVNTTIADRVELYSIATIEDVVTVTTSVADPVTTTAQGNDTTDTQGNVTKVFNNYTDTTTTNTNTVTTTTPTTTTVYADGSPDDILLGSAEIDTLTDTVTNDVSRVELYSTATVEDVVTTQSSTSDPVVTTTQNDNTESTEGNVTEVYYNYTDTTSVDTIVTITTTPTTTTVFSSGADNIVTTGTVTSVNNTTTETSNATRNELFSTATTVDVVTSATTVGDSTVTTTYEDVPLGTNTVNETTGDVTYDFTRVYEDTTTIDTTVTTITTPTTTTVFSSGADSIVTTGVVSSVDETTTDTSVSTRTETVQDIMDAEDVFDTVNIGTDGKDTFKESGHGSGQGSGTEDNDFSGDDFFFGGGGRDNIYAGEGDDFLSGGTGRDKLFGEDGNDTFIYDAADKKIDGGSGDDMVLFGGSGQTFSSEDLDNALRDIETLDITGTGDNTLVIDKSDLKKMTDGDNELKIMGNAGDSVQLKGNWQQGESNDGYTVHTNGNASITISDEITVT